MRREQIVVDCIDLDQTDATENFLLVSEAERERAAAHRSSLDARRFVARRAQSRIFLSEIIGTPPRDIRFSEGRYGKPLVDGSPVSFSTSHANGLLLIAVGWDRQIGCDIEYRQLGLDVTELMPLALTASEIRWFAALGEEARIDAFYDRWTCKEAYIKAIGTGFSTPMNSFAITRDPLRIITASGTGEDWSARSWSPARGYRAALVVEGHDYGVRQRGTVDPVPEPAFAQALGAHNNRVDPY